MRRGGTVLPLLLCVGLSGCFAGENLRSPGWLERLHAPRLPLGPDAVIIDWAVVELPLADKFINTEVWECADCQDREGLLADNGLRAGQVIGMLPGKLQHLLGSERHLFDRRRQILAAGHTTVIPLGAPEDVFTYRVRSDAGAADVALEQGQGTLLLQPALAGEGRVRLKFTPQVLYGVVMPDYQIAPDRSGFQLEFKRPSKTYPALSWETTLAPNQVLIVGTHFDETAAEDTPETFGSQSFLQETSRGTVQRLLVVRATRGQADPGSDWHAGGAPTPQGGEAAGLSAADSAGQGVSAAAHCLAASGP
jgi:hypothetical protein